MSAPARAPSSASGSKKEKATEKRKSKAKTPYEYFLESCHTQHLSLFPESNLNGGDFAMQCSQRWASLAEEEKKQFNDAAQGNLERVVMEKGLTNLEKEKAPRRPRASKKAFKDPNAPKKAMSSFLWFCDEMRPIVRNAHPTLTIGETAKILGHMWKDTDKSKYEAIAARDKERFTRESNEYKDRLDAEAKVMEQAQVRAHKQFLRGGGAAAGQAPSATMAVFDFDSEDNPRQLQQHFGGF